MRIHSPPSPALIPLKTHPQKLVPCCICIYVYIYMHICTFIYIFIKGVSRWGLGFCIEVILGVKDKCDAKASSAGWVWYWLF